MGEELVGGFNYNDVLDAWTLDPTVLVAYAEH